MLRIPSSRKIVVSLIVIAALTAAILLFQRGDAKVASTDYTIARITRGTVTQAVKTTGQLSPWVSVEVSTQISGLVTAVEVDFNSAVRKGQVLARIDPSTYQQRLRQTEADLAAAEANYRLTVLNAERLEGLRAQDLVTQQDYDQAEAQRELSHASLLTRRATVENARVDLERCTLVSPIDGVVIFRQVEVGKTIQASFSAPTLFVIAQDLRKMRIIAPISEVDVASVHPDQPVSFGVDSMPGRTFTGRLAQIRNPYTPPEKQQQQQNAQSPIAQFDAVIEVDNRDLLLRPSLTANVSVIVTRRDGVLRIPNSALKVSLPAAKDPGDGMATVHRLPGGDRSAMPEAVRVRLGLSDGIDTEVVSGLNEGDTVITGLPKAGEPRRGRRLF